MIFSFLYFLFPSSAVLYYGIGTNQVIMSCDELPSQTMRVLKAIFTVLVTTTLTMIFNNAVLSPVGLIDLYPLFALLIFISVSISSEIVIRISTKDSASEFTISFLTVLLSVQECFRVSEGIFVSLSCILSFYSICFIIYIIKRRVMMANTPECMTNSSLIFLAMSFLMIILTLVNVSWLNPGVLK